MNQNPNRKKDCPSAKAGPGRAARLLRADDQRMEYLVVPCLLLGIKESPKESERADEARDPITNYVPQEGVHVGKTGSVFLDYAYFHQLLTDRLAVVLAAQVDFVEEQEDEVDRYYHQPGQNRQCASRLLGGIPAGCNYHRDDEKD